MKKTFLSLAFMLSLSGPGNGAELLGLYDFEGNGNDSSTAGNDATSVDPGVTYTTGFGGVGQAASFSRDDSGIGVVVPIDVSFGTRASVTIGGWIQAFETEGGGA